MEWASLVSKQAWSRPVDALPEKCKDVNYAEYVEDADESNETVDCWGKASRYNRYFKLKPC